MQAQSTHVCCCCCCRRRRKTQPWSDLLRQRVPMQQWKWYTQQLMSSPRQHQVRFVSYWLHALLNRWYMRFEPVHLHTRCCCHWCRVPRSRSRRLRSVQPRVPFKRRQRSIHAWGHELHSQPVQLSGGDCGTRRCVLRASVHVLLLVRRGSLPVARAEHLREVGGVRI